MDGSDGSFGWLAGLAGSLAFGRNGNGNGNGMETGLGFASDGAEVVGLIHDSCSCLCLCL